MHGAPADAAGSQRRRDASGLKTSKMTFLEEKSHWSLRTRVRLDWPKREGKDSWK